MDQKCSTVAFATDPDDLDAEIIHLVNQSDNQHTSDCCELVRPSTPRLSGSISTEKVAHDADENSSPSSSAGSVSSMKYLEPDQQIENLPLERSVLYHPSTSIGLWTGETSQSAKLQRNSTVQTSPLREKETPSFHHRTPAASPISSAPRLDPSFEKGPPLEGFEPVMVHIAPFARQLDHIGDQEKLLHEARQVVVGYVDGSAEHTPSSKQRLSVSSSATGSLRRLDDCFSKIDTRASYTSGTASEDGRCQASNSPPSPAFGLQLVPSNEATASDPCAAYTFDSPLRDVEDNFEDDDPDHLGSVKPAVSDCSTSPARLGFRRPQQSLRLLRHKRSSEEIIGPQNGKTMFDEMEKSRVARRSLLTTSAAEFPSGGGAKQGSQPGSGIMEADQKEDPTPRRHDRKDGL